MATNGNECKVSDIKAERYPNYQSSQLTTDYCIIISITRISIELNSAIIR